MQRNRKVNFLSVLLLFALLLTSCGGANPEADTIATAVAMTVSAQGTQQAQATNTPLPTEAAPTSASEATSLPGTTPTVKAASTFSPPTAPGSAGSVQLCEVVANLIGETIPDGTIMQPSQAFQKTWRIKNNGTCTWNTSYKIVYWSGDLMGAAMEYPLPAVVPPGSEIEIPLSLVAPASNGNYSSFWKLKSEWGTPFGVGQYDQPFYVQINVNSSTNPDFAVTNVTYNVIRDPVAGCATNVFFKVQATISTNGPAEVYYRWVQSDGNDSGEKKLTFKNATSMTVEREWSMHLGVSPGSKWMKLVITAPDYVEFPQAALPYDCQ